jgi:hypothetical protein
MKQGAGATTPKGAQAAIWSNAGLAARLDEARNDADATTSPQMIANWRQGRYLPANVEPLIEALFGDGSTAAAEDLRKVYRAAKAEDVARGAARLRRSTGKPFSIEDDRATLDRGPRPTDLARAQSAEQQSLQKAVRAQAEALAVKIGKADDGGAQGEVGETAAGLAEVAALAPPALVPRLTDLYVLATRLGGFVKTDNIRRHEFGRNAPPLPADAAGALTALVQIAFAWALGFPSVQKLDGRAKSLETPATVEDARALFEAARDEDALRAVDALTLQNLADAAHPDTAPGRKAEALTKIFGADLAGLIAEALARAALGDPDAQRFAQKGLEALRREPQAADRLAGSELAKAAAGLGTEAAAPAPPPEDGPRVFLSYAHKDARWRDELLHHLRPLSRHAALTLWEDSDLAGGDLWRERIDAQLATCDVFLLIVSTHAVGSRFILDVEIAAIEARIARGEPVRLYAVKATPTSQTALAFLADRFQLRPARGRALSQLPKPDRDHTLAALADEIAKLARRIPEYVEKEARALILKGVAPPAHWRGHIRELDFFRTGLADAAPLAGLTALALLELSRTQIADAAPFASLTALRSLHLSDTQIADAAPLAGLTALTSLNLRGTQITDAAPLAGLVALRSLSLAGTKIADAAPLAGLTALTRLGLSDTKIADAAPLAGLTALTSLDLSFTQIADAAPLAGLTALASLGLAGTQIADTAPLADLRQLEALFLTRTRVADLSPLAVLTKLKELYLEGVPANDLTPLADLIANGLNIVGKDVPAALRAKRKPR